MENKPFSNVVFKECIAEPIPNLCRNMTPQVSSNRRLIASPSLKSNFGPVAIIRKSPIINQRDSGLGKVFGSSKKEKIDLLQQFSRISTRSKFSVKNGSLDEFSYNRNSVIKEEEIKERDEQVSNPDIIKLAKNVNTKLKSNLSIENENITPESKIQIISKESPETSKDNVIFCYPSDCYSLIEKDCSNNISNNMVTTKIISPTEISPNASDEIKTENLELENSKQTPIYRKEKSNFKNGINDIINSNTFTTEFDCDADDFDFNEKKEMIQIIPAFKIKKKDFNCGTTNNRLKKMRNELMKIGTGSMK